MTKKPYFQTTLFKPSVVKNVDGTAKVNALSLADSAQDSFGAMSPTASFRFDPPGTGLKNTQQLNVDFSKFENHTFFNSARNKTHVAIDKIINYFPFDGTRSEHETFLNSIDGFEKYVLDRFPKNVGFLNFSRSIDPVGSYMSVKDFQGVGAVSGPTTQGKTVLDFKSGPFSIEFSIYIPAGSANTNEIIAQRLTSVETGFTIALSSSLTKALPNSQADLVFALTNPSKQISCSTEVEKGKFNHVAMVYDRGANNRLNVYINGKPTSVSNSGEIGAIDFIGTNLNIGSGSKHESNGFEFTPQKTLSGSLDEFRYFLSKRTESEIKKYRERELFAQDDLKLYFRFNEPSGSFDKNGVGNNSLVLDYSGNGLHTAVTNFDISLRNTGSVAITSKPTLSENANNSPVLFPSFSKVQALASSLMTEASKYDFNNPNLITKLVPRHYLDDAAVLEGLTSTEGDLSQTPGMREDKPGGNILRQSQIVSSILFTWASVFDDVKMFIDEASRLLKVDYVNDQTISDHLLPFLANYHGFALPTQFNSVTIDQYMDGRQLTVDSANNNASLQNIQNTIWRRILSDLPTIRKTKGTHASFRSVLRNMGINPDGAFRIREYGGSKTTRISDNFARRREVGSMMSFTGSFTAQGSIDGEGKDNSRPLIMSPFLSGTRIEQGYPLPKGNVTSLGSTEAGDGLFTSGSWSLEGLYKFDKRIIHPATQSLMRLQTTGSSSGVGNNWLTYNLIARKPDPSTGVKGSVTLYGAPGKSAPSAVMKIDMPNLNIFDGNKWHVSFGRRRADIDNNHSSSYYVRAGKTSISGFYLTESIGYLVDSADNVLNTLTPTMNASGSFIAVGSMSLGYDTTWGHTNFLNSHYDTDSQQVNFTGKVAGLRFFSKDLSKKETAQHVRNFKSVGVDNPLLNFNFNTSETGSFERLRVDLSLDQMATKSDGLGKIEVFDFSQNLLHGIGTGFEKSAQIIHPETFDYKTFEPKFETSRADNKIRIRSFKSPEKVDDYGVLAAPLYELPQGEKPDDDRRFEIEISSVQALNDDIMNIFATLDFFDNAIGEPTYLFSSEYRDLRNMRRIYFNRLEDKISFKKFFEFFKWFDMTVGDIFEELVPRTSRYLGTNFVIENHALERPKFTYRFTDMYIGELDRRAESKIFLQQIVGSIKKY